MSSIGGAWLAARRRMRVRSLLLVSLAVFTVPGCRKHDPAPAPGPAVSVTTTSSDAGASQMARHEALALELRDAVHRADLPGARRAARELSRVRISPASAEYGERHLDMALAAASAAEAEDVVDAGRALGALAQTCADCHARLTGPTRLAIVGTVPTRTMPRHAWAADRLWDGLIANSEPPWRAGAAILADQALVAEELTPNKTPMTGEPREGRGRPSAGASPLEDRTYDRFAAAVQASGRAALATTDAAERARILGDIVAACAGCHERTGGGAGR